MYAGTTIRHGSGRFVGVHQKIDRSARRYLKKITPNTISFPDIKSILYFEGNNGSDGIKRKSQTIDQPWYFINPTKINEDEDLLVVIDNHIYNLSVALREKDRIKAAFEAAWLAHAIVDGLTPAHHYPLGDKIEELWGKLPNERNSIKEKNIIPGDGLRDILNKNWEYWGAGGVFTKHGMFEFGVASAISAYKFQDIHISNNNILNVKQGDFRPIYLESLRKVDSMKMYDALGKKGWTQQLAKQTKEVLIPEIIKIVVLGWYKAMVMSESKI